MEKGERGNWIGEKMKKKKKKENYRVEKGKEGL